MKNEYQKNSAQGESSRRKVGSISRPNIFQYSSAREIIRDFIEYLRLIGTYSNKRFARDCGFGSHTYVHLLIRGEREVTESSLTKLAFGFGLNSEELEYFRTIVNLNKASTEEDRQHLLRKIEALKALQSREIETKVKSERSDELAFSVWGSVKLSPAKAAEVRKKAIDCFKLMLAEVEASGAKDSESDVEEVTIRLSLE